MMNSSFKNRKGLLFVVSAPSGAGKTTLCQEVVQSVTSIRHSISYTTREPRSGEVNGKHYFFVDELEFRKMLEQEKFLEWAEVHGHLYGTTQEVFEDFIHKGQDVILDIDCQGAKKLREKEVAGIYIYILPPSFETLKTRLKDRQSDTSEEVSRRLDRAQEEVRSFQEYHYLIVNDNFKNAKKALESIVLAERLKMSRIDLNWIEDNFLDRQKPQDSSHDQREAGSK